MPTGALIAGVGTGIVGAGASIFGANKAAAAQTAAAQNANAILAGQYNTNAATLAPWMTAGANSNALVNYLTGASGSAPVGYNGNIGGQGALTNPFAPTMAQLEQTPGYQFTLNQGLKGVQNSYAAKGLGGSGAAMKGAADYAQGNAANTYQQQFQNYWSQNRDIYNMLTGQSQQGLSAAAALAGSGNTLATGQSSNLTGAGTAQAAAANSYGPAITSVGNSLMSYGILNNFLSNGTAPISDNAYWGGGSIFSGDAYGGSSKNPIPGLSPSDYGPGY
jgi:hypothetical protein